MGTLGWVVIGIVFVGLHLVMHRGHASSGTGSHGAAHTSMGGGCCGGGHDHGHGGQEGHRESAE